MTPVKLKIMVRAARARMESGEDLEDILSSWPALTDTDRDQIRETLDVSAFHA